MNSVFKILLLVTIIVFNMIGCSSWTPMMVSLPRREMLLSSAWTMLNIGGDNVKKYSSGVSEDWSGTNLPLLTLVDNGIMSSATNDTTRINGDLPMARYPDPILRRPAKEIDPKWFGTKELNDLANALQLTARKNGAVGLAAQQCGVDARMVYLDNGINGRFLLNPHIIQRSPELQMRVWTEHCLVLPPWIDITTLRDASITVQYQTLSGKKQIKTFMGEPARALQHEMDHDRGILILDHVPTIQDLPADWIQDIERDRFEERQILAYDRSIYYDNNDNDNTNNNKYWNFVSPANAMEEDKEQQQQQVFDREQWLKDRRALLQQSRSSTNRQEIMDLSKQRARLIYNTTYQGASCVSGLPCL